MGPERSPQWRGPTVDLMVRSAALPEFDGNEDGIRDATPQLLVVDDDRVHLAYVSEVLSRQSGYQVKAIEGGKAAWEWLRNTPPNQLPNLILCDWTMPDLSGVDICRRVKATPDFRLIYFILLTARAEVEDRVKGLDAGADEFITKPVDPEELQARVRAGLRLQQLTHALVQANRQLQARNELLESLSLTDPLTGVLNRRALDQALPQILKQVGPRFSEARYRSLCLLMLDVDYFKKVNDTHGHFAGDCVLRAVAQRLQSQQRSSSLLYRYGGEEFVCITPGLNLKRSLNYAEFLRQLVAREPIVISPKRSIPITISIGGSVVIDTHIGNVQEVVNSADKALYEAKQQGRNRVEMTLIEGGDWVQLNPPQAQPFEE